MKFQFCPWLGKCVLPEYKGEETYRDVGSMAYLHSTNLFTIMYEIWASVHNQNAGAMPLIQSLITLKSDYCIIEGQ